MCRVDSQNIRVVSAGPMSEKLGDTDGCSGPERKIQAMTRETNQQSGSPYLKSRIGVVVRRPGTINLGT
jgi:hypothetical protein